MLAAVYIFVDDEFDDPIYAEPEIDDLDPDLRVQLCEAIDEALEGDRASSGVFQVGEHLVGYRTQLRNGLSFAAVVEEAIGRSDLLAYLTDLASAYMDEVDDPRNPERDGVADVVMDVIPSWED